MSFLPPLQLVHRPKMRTFTRPVAFLLLALGLCSLPWANASPVCDTEIPCSQISGRSSVPSTSDFSKRQDFSNAERLRKRLPLKPPTRIRASLPPGNRWFTDLPKFQSPAIMMAILSRLRSPRLLIVVSSRFSAAILHWAT